MRAILLEFQLPSLIGSLSITGVSFFLVFLAELGDKSQLVCMTLAAKHNRPWPVLVGAMLAFAVLNLLAVLFGALVASWIPEFWLALIIAGLFGFFGVQSLLTVDDPEKEHEGIRSNRGLFLTALLTIFVAEFGDKTQLAVAGLASNYHGLPVWFGATLALLVTTALGVIVGQRLLTRLPPRLIHKFSGVLFLLLALVSLYRAFV
ncbi:MAG: putative Ca2+/H+ antiporter (TMEM165/GDT1 family) [Candidatus Azotimanducaceae bacterium]